MNALEPAAMEAASATDTGQIRVANQDSWGAFTDADGARLFVVADGMGGHRGGETASRLAVEAMGDVFRRSGEDPEVTLRNAFETANERIWRLAQQQADLAGMGTTGVALLLCPGGALWLAHVGDSRAYRLRNGVLERLTADHSMVEAMRAQGLLTEEEAAHHPDRNVILRSLGVQPTVEVDLAAVRAEPGDCFLLCSDGLSSVVPEPDIRVVLERNQTADAARLLVDLANQRGGPDNVTVQVVRIPGGERAGEPRTDEARTVRSPGSAPVRIVDQTRRARRVRRVAVAAIALAGVLAALVAWLLLRA
jgi:serine/threonine protein phosphatase PrpC